MKITFLTLIIAGALAFSCQKTEAPPRKTHELLHAVLWMQKSAEYKALTLQTYGTAKVMLDQALKDKNWTAALEQTGDFKNLAPAVILDADETVLDNLPMEAQLIQSGQFYNDSLWNVWCNLRVAQPVPGALDFCKYAESKGVAVFYVTNRKDLLKEATRENLKNTGFPLDDSKETILTRTDVSDKGKRRAQVAAEYRILLLIGDNNGDFASTFTKNNMAARDSLVTVYNSYWGKKWIVLPNPVYGDWESALFNYDYSLSDEQKLIQKFNALNIGQ